MSRPTESKTPPTYNQRALASIFTNAKFPKAHKEALLDAFDEYSQTIATNSDCTQLRNDFTKVQDELKDVARRIDAGTLRIDTLTFPITLLFVGHFLAILAALKWLI